MVGRLVMAVARPIASVARAFPWRLALSTAVVPLALVVAFAIVFRTANQDLVYPGVTAAGRPLGGMDARLARSAIREAAIARLDEEVTLRSGDLTWRRSLRSLGLGIDDRMLDRWIDDVWAIGHRTTWGAWWTDQVDLALRRVDVPGWNTVDIARARASLDPVSRALERDPVDAEVVLAQSGDRYEVHLTPSRTGVRVDVDATIDAILTGARRASLGTIDVVVNVTRASVDTEALRGVMAAAGALVDDPIELVDPANRARRFALDAPSAHAMLKLARVPGESVVTASLDPAALRAWVQGIGDVGGTPAQNPRLVADPGGIRIAQGVTGRRIDVEATARRVEAALRTSNHAVDLAMVPDVPWVPVAVVEEARQQIETATRDPITFIIPADGTRPERRVVPSPDRVAEWLSLPDTQAIPRDTARLAPTARPRLDWGIDIPKFTTYVDRELMPLVSALPVEPRLAVVARPDPFAAAATPRALPTAVPDDPVSLALARLLATPTPLGTATPSGAARTAIALGTALARPATTTAAVAATSTPPATSVVGPTPSIAGPSPSSTTTPTAVAPGSPLAFRFEAVVVAGRPGRTIDVDLLARAVEARLREGLSPLSPVLVVPVTGTPPLGSGAPSPTRTATARPTASATATPTATGSMTPSSTPTRAATVTVTRTIGGTSAAATATAQAASVPPFWDARSITGGTPTLGMLAGTPQTGVGTPAPFTAASMPGRPVVVPVVDRAPVAAYVELAQVARVANVLLALPVVVEWAGHEWTVDPNDLVDMLRVGPVGQEGVTAYLSRDGLVRAAERIGREAPRLADAPRDDGGAVLAVDVPRTAAGIWAAANLVGEGRRSEVAWIEDDPTPVAGAPTATAESGRPMDTRTPVRNPTGRPQSTPTPSATITPLA